MPIHCTDCGRAVSHNADESREMLWIENDHGELVGVRCIGCQTREERADVVTMIRRAVERSRRRSA